MPKNLSKAADKSRGNSKSEDEDDDFVDSGDVEQGISLSQS
jgi:hypothetical protein